MGGLIKEGQEAGRVAKAVGRGFNQYRAIMHDTNNSKPKTLSQIGLTAHPSSDFQTIARMPEETNPFDVFVKTLIE